jgi:uncharacterized protein YwqG
MTIEGPFRTLEELGGSLASAGVSVADQKMLLALARPSIALQSKAAEDGRIPVGASKIGGAPDLPLGTAWPTRGPTAKGADEVRTLQQLDAENPSDYFKGEVALKEPLAKRPAPLTFMLQVDLAECAAAGELDPDIPREGRFLVFYDLIFRPWYGHEEGGNPLFQLLYVTADAASLVRQSPPDLGYPLFGEEEDYRAFRNQLPPARLRPVFTLTLPDTGSLPFMTYYPRGRKVPHEDWMYNGPTHLNASNRVGGWPENIQKDMAVELAAAEAAIELPFSQDYWSAAESMQPLANQWVHLLQIGDYDNTINDFDGLYHIWIKREHLRARDFTKARLIYRTS